MRSLVTVLHSIMLTQFQTAAVTAHTIWQCAAAWKVPIAKDGDALRYSISGPAYLYVWAMQVSSSQKME